MLITSKSSNLRFKSIFLPLTLIVAMISGLGIAPLFQFPVYAVDGCATPTVITGGGSYAVNAGDTCFKYVNSTFVRGGMFSVMNGADATVSNVVKWYGGRNETVTNCINDSQTLNGNGAQLNNFTVAKDSGSAMYVSITANKANTVSLSIQNWQNGSGCSVAPTPVSGGGPTNTSAPTNTPTNTPVGPTNTPTNTPVGPTATPTNTSVPTNTPTRTNTPASGGATYQAENATIGGGAFFENTNGGFNGTGYINFPLSGGFLEFTNVDGGSGGNVTLQFRNALGVTTSRTGQLTVNGSTQSITFSPTGAWTTWLIHSVTVSLNSGTSNTIRLTTNGQDLANIDQLAVGSGGPTPTTGPTATHTPTRTNTPVGPTPTRTPTPVSGGGWPTAQGEQAVTASISVSGVFDGGMKRYYGSGDLGTGGQSESQDPIFDLAAGATLKNVILGAPAADGVHCAGACTLQNVWWEDVGEDAATFRGSSSSISSLVDGGGARLASDKVFQHNGAGTLTIRNFLVENFGKLYRSCGNCSTQYQRNVVMDNVTARAPGSALSGINTNYGDTARFTRITIIGNNNMSICDKFTGNNTGAEPPKIGSGADGVNCFYSPSDITYQ